MKIKSATVTECFPNGGICDRQIYYNNSALTNGPQPEIGTKVSL